MSKYDHQNTIFGVALNYRSLLASNQATFQEEPYKNPPIKPVLFIKTPNTRNHHQGKVIFPKGERLQPGPALAVVMGKTASRVSEEAAMDYVLGYCLANDFSLPEESYYRPAIKGKCRDGFCALGAIIPKEAVAHPDNLSVSLYVNGEIKQENTTANLYRSISKLIAELSEFMTLFEGDILLTGTPEGRVDVLPGDRVEVRIEGLGVLENTVEGDAS